MEAICETDDESCEEELSCYSPSNEKLGDYEYYRDESEISEYIDEVDTYNK